MSDGLIDAESDDNIAVLITRVADSQVQAVLRLMHSANQHQFQSYCSVVTKAVADMQQSFLSAMTYERSGMMHPPMPLAPQPVLPLFIDANPRSSSSSPSTDTGGGSFSSHSSMTDGVAIRSSDGALIGLKCLFCHHYHVIEKSHCQHYDRLLSRVETGERYFGKCVIPDTHWIYQLAGFGESKEAIARKFITTLLSHLRSGNEKSIDPSRAGCLVQWLQSLSR
jgi:hypothetical protein